MAVASGQWVSRAHLFLTRTVAAARAWGRMLSTAAGVAAAAGSAQLGVAYGLEVVRFRRQFTNDGLWATQLTWAAWVASLAVIAGAAGGLWMARRRDAGGTAPRLELGQRIAVALAAGAGAAVTVALTALPARQAGLTGADPALEAALAAALGLVAGVLATVAALSLRVVAVSVTVMAAMVWLVALISVVPTLGPDGGPPLVRLGVLDLSLFGDGSRSPAAVLSPPIVALLVGLGVAAAARSIGLPRPRAVLSGAAGPVLLVLPYLIAPPRGGDTVQAAAFGGALTAVAAGLLAAVTVTLVRLPGKGPGGATTPVTPDPWEAGPPPTGTAPVVSPPVNPPWYGQPEPPPEPPRPEPPRPEAGVAGPSEELRTEPPPEPPAGPAQAGPPEPAEHPEPAEPPEPDTGSAPPPRRRERRHREEAHVDWVRSLAGADEDDDQPPPEPGRRRLRRDRGHLADDLDDPGLDLGPDAP